VNVLVTGAGGMLALALRGELQRRGHSVVALGRAELDVTERRAVEHRIADATPDAVVQCAAYTAVDAAETNEAAAMQVNAVATEHVARACHRVGARLVYPSTDYVFDGSGNQPYRPDDVPRPVGAYGRSKLAGEAAALDVPGSLVVRTSWLYGEGGANFVDTMLRLARERSRLAVVDDQIGRPTWTGTLARVMVDLLEREASGIFHATDGGEPTTWYGFARQVFEETSIPIPVDPVSTSAFPRPALRPRYSVLDCAATEAALRRPLTDWKVALRRYLGRSPADED
jgi:dTDP-4-dehydrorhamnose reductase